MEIQEYLPFWGKLTDAQRALVRDTARPMQFARGAVLHEGGTCTGLVIVTQGRLRAYTLSGEGRELTLYRLLERDICLFSASCALRGLDVDITLSAETDTEILLLPSEVFKELQEQSAAVAGFANEMMATRFSDVMWLMDQLLNRKLDSRLAAFLLEESNLEGAETLSITHERIAAHMGSAREVVTRMLKYFQNEGLVQLGRGSVTLLDADRLRAVAGDSLR